MVKTITTKEKQKVSSFGKGKMGGESRRVSCIRSSLTAPLLMLCINESEKRVERVVPRKVGSPMSGVKKNQTIERIMES